jgi:hypothetical protein
MTIVRESSLTHHWPTQADGKRACHFHNSYVVAPEFSPTTVQEYDSSSSRTGFPSSGKMMFLVQ